MGAEHVNRVLGDVPAEDPEGKFNVPLTSGDNKRVKPLSIPFAYLRKKSKHQKATDEDVNTGLYEEAYSDKSKRIIVPLDPAIKEWDGYEAIEAHIKNEAEINETDIEEKDEHAKTRFVLILGATAAASVMAIRGYQHFHNKNHK